MSETAVQYAFPPALTGRADLSRLLRELEVIDNDLESQRARATDKSQGYHLPTMSQAMSDFLELNKVDMANDHARMQLTTNLRKLKDRAPVIHMTFATEADPQSLGQIVAWARKELHPQALISVGLQPSLIGGVYVRTPNHVHDYTIRANMKKSREILTKDIASLVRGVQ